ncbi:hypothetical protein JQS43_08520 [Natronosporangium hydrolyticum]|uniref:TPR repeat domain-containing protein n=1 Tax=Natronosporangium hydrolyticum TaxID=2811111 RepID=A0A895YQP0_9ACTN|nr:hypothetical protein [Natronosporangium hydrolyticum]QSB16318.1 hypothetical protein JQS43_08520 [Natronosporangium hydrolyticum]
MVTRLGEGRVVVGEFEHYPISPETVWQHADVVGGHAGDVERLGDDVHGAHQRAQQGVAGLLEHPMVAAEQPVARQVGGWLGSVVFAGGAIRHFGDAVHTYNSGIDDLNRRWREAVDNRFGVPAPDTSGAAGAVEESRILEEHGDAVAVERQAYWRKLEQERVTQWEEALDESARQVAQMLDAGPDDAESVLALFEAGALPLASPLVFPTVDFGSVDAHQMYENLLNSGRLPDLESMSDQELDEWLRNHPAEADQLQVVLAVTGPLSPGQERVAQALGRYDAWQVDRGMEMPPGRPGLDQIGAGSQRLAGINAGYAETGSMTAAERAYLEAWYDGVGADNLAALPAYVTAASQGMYPGIDYGTGNVLLETYREQYLSPIADGIMNLSHEVGGLDNMPQAIQDLVNTPMGSIGEPPHRLPSGLLDEHGNLHRDLAEWDLTIDGLAQYEGFVSLLEASTVEGGEKFTSELGQSALRVKQELNTIAANITDILETPDIYLVNDGDAIERAWADARLATHDDEVSRMLSVVARNEDASAKLLLDNENETRSILLGMNWYDDRGVVDIIDAGTGRDLEGDGAGMEKQAKAAMALMKELGGDRDFYLDRTTDNMQTAIVDMGIRWMDTFGRNLSNNMNTEVGQYLYNLDDDLRLGIQIKHDERQNFLQFIAGTSDEESIRFRAASALYAEDLLVDALQRGNAVDVDRALAVAGRLDGAINAAEYTYVMDQVSHDQAENEAAWQTETRRNAGYALAAEMAWDGASTAATLNSGGLASVVTAAASPAVSSLIETVFDPDDRGDYRDYEALVMRQDRDLEKDLERNYFLLAAYEKAGIEPNLDLQTGGTQARVDLLYDDEGRLRPLKDIGEPTDEGVKVSAEERDAFADAENVTRREWSDRNGQQFEMNSYTEERDTIDSGAWEVNSHGESVRPDPPRNSGWGDGDTARGRLYGDDYHDELRRQSPFTDPDELYRNGIVEANR